MLGAVKVGTKADALIGDFSKFGQTEYLITAGIGENGPVPGHEFVQTAQLANPLVAGTQIKVVGIAENDLRAEFFQRFVAEAFYRSLRAYGHENRRFDQAVRSGQSSAPRTAGFRFGNLESERHAL